MMAGAEGTGDDVMSVLKMVRAALALPDAGDDARAPAAEVPMADPEASASMLNTLCATFGLTSFERNLLVMAAGMQLDPDFGVLCAARGAPTRPYPTFGLALTVFRVELPWRALDPTGPLRRWRLLEVGASDSVLTAPLAVDERVLHALLGGGDLDERLVALAHPLVVPDELVPSHARAASTISRRWSAAEGGRLPVVHLLGSDEYARRAIAARAAADVGLEVFGVAAPDLPQDVHDLDAFARLWEREAVFAPRALQVDAGEDAAAVPAVLRLVADLASALIISSTGGAIRSGQRESVAVEVEHPSPDELRTIWTSLLGLGEGGGDLADRLAAQFDLSLTEMRAAAREARDAAADADDSGPKRDEILDTPAWQGARRRARPQLAGLAVRIEPRAGWKDLVVPARIETTLKAIVQQVRHRATVYDRWGLTPAMAAGRGVTALFSGTSGVGKTMAAGVIADDLKLDLYRIDLSSVVSKYIGETEKNLSRVFDGAERGGVILLFDEADALFGRRSEVRDSHDRYANIEVSYLLQRMEAYDGLAILTTNMQEALDPSFARRIRFAVEFPFPDANLRQGIWTRVLDGLPDDARGKDLDAQRLARLNVTGAGIRNIALQAAFLSADRGRPIDMAAMRESAELEYAKLKRQVSSVEQGAWA
jgi:hypothetical protein